MVFATPDGSKFATPRPPRRRAQSAYSAAVLENILGFDHESRITGISFDTSREIVSIYFDNPRLPVVPEGQECPEILPDSVDAYAEQYAQWQLQRKEQRQENARAAGR